MQHAELESLAREFGFERAGIAGVDAEFDGYPHFQRWIEDGNHATMHFLKEQVELRRSVQSVLPGAQSAILFAKNYAQPNPYRPGYPRIARYALNRDYHNVLRARLKKLVIRLQVAFPNDTFRVFVDSAPILERELAHRAGLGWFGKNTMLIDSKTGSYFLLSGILTTAVLPASEPSVGGCGNCSACIDACPTGAIELSGERWQVDSRKCISAWTIEHKGEIPKEFSHKFGAWTFGCDICQEVCPFNQPRESQPARAATTQDERFLARPMLSLQQIIESPDDQLVEFSNGTPLARAKPAGLKRNAKISQENAQIQETLNLGGEEI